LLIADAVLEFVQGALKYCQYCKSENLMLCIIFNSGASFVLNNMNLNIKKFRNLYYMQSPVGVVLIERKAEAMERMVSVDYIISFYEKMLIFSG
jgi:hypothetical protein